MKVKNKGTVDEGTGINSNAVSFFDGMPTAEELEAEEGEYGLSSKAEGIALGQDDDISMKIGAGADEEHHMHERGTLFTPKFMRKLVVFVVLLFVLAIGSAYYLSSVWGEDRGVLINAIVLVALGVSGLGLALTGIFLAFDIKDYIDDKMNI